MTLWPEPWQRQAPPTPSLCQRFCQLKNMFSMKWSFLTERDHPGTNNLFLSHFLLFLIRAASCGWNNNTWNCHTDQLRPFIEAFVQIISMVSFSDRYSNETWSGTETLRFCSRPKKNLIQHPKITFLTILVGKISFNKMLRSHFDVCATRSERH